MFYFRTATSRLGQRRAQSTLRLPAIDLKEHPLYSRRPAWWIRWAYALVACDLLFTGNGCYTSWTRWTVRVDDPKSPTSAALPSAEEPAYELRPAWQRMSLNIIQMLGGAGAAALLLMFRSRTVQTLRILKPGSSPHLKVNSPMLFLQTHGQRGTKGRLFDIKKCDLLGDGLKEKRVLVQATVEGAKKETFMLELDKATVLGKISSVEETNQAIARAWELANKPLKSGWASGPMAEA